MGAQLSWSLPVALAILLVLALAVAWLGRLRLSGDIAIAAGRAILQLVVVSLVLAVVLNHLWLSIAFVVLMFAVAVLTSSRRSGVRTGWWWVAVDIAAGVVPVLAVIFCTRSIPWSGAGLLPMAGIVIGGTMTAHSLALRRAFAALRDEYGQFEAGLSLGLSPAQAVAEVVRRHLPDALHPAIDQTRSVGLVTLPGTFIGVLLGGGSAIQAGSAQLLVLFGQIAAETIAVVVAHRFIGAGLLLPPDLRAAHSHAWR